MKSFIYLACMVLLTLNAQATIFHVNNSTGTPGGTNGIYDDPKDAHDDAFDGDTLIIDGSINPYTGFLTITKRLVISGPGYFQSENPATNTFPAVIRGISLRPASGGNANSGAAGSIIQGLSFTYTIGQDIQVYVSDVIIRKNTLREVLVRWNPQPADQVRRVIITQNYFFGISQTRSHIYSSVSTTSPFQDMTISNNIFEAAIFVPQFSVADVHNNLFIAPQVTITNLQGVVRNNIFLGNNPNYNFTADSVTHNISEGPGLSAGNGNIRNVNPANIFVLNPAQNGTDGQYILRSNSMATNAGYRGEDIGPYGGLTSYIQYGVGAAPNIWFLSVNPVINPGDKLKVQLRAVSGD
ncbi:MAG: hypothetical protein AAGI38_08490 [Bacteroidota bacterium]